MTLDDLELLKIRIFGKFRGILQIWEATTAKGKEWNRPVLSATALQPTEGTFEHYVPGVDLHAVDFFAIHVLLSRAYIRVS